MWYIYIYICTYKYRYVKQYLFLYSFCAQHSLTAQWQSRFFQRQGWGKIRWYIVTLRVRSQGAKHADCRKMRTRPCTYYLRFLGRCFPPVMCETWTWEEERSPKSILVTKVSTLAGGLPNQKFSEKKVLLSLTLLYQQPPRPNENLETCT